MIVNLRGTSGSGKSHTLREIMKLYGGKDEFEPWFKSGRKQPLYYISNRPGPNGRKLFIPGHYETACGGCDTISHGSDAIFEIIRKGNSQGHDVLFEGLLITVEYNRTLAMHTDGLPLAVHTINIPLQECLDSILTRRRIKNPDAEPVNPKNTTAKHRQAWQTHARLSKVGVTCRMGDRAEVLAWTKEALGW